MPVNSASSTLTNRMVASNPIDNLVLGTCYKPDFMPTFALQVLSLSVQNTPVNPSTSDPVMYRIFTDQNFGVIPDGDE